MSRWLLHILHRHQVKPERVPAPTPPHAWGGEKGEGILRSITLILMPMDDNCTSPFPLFRSPFWGASERQKQAWMTMTKQPDGVGRIAAILSTTHGNTKCRGYDGGKNPQGHDAPRLCGLAFGVRTCVPYVCGVNSSIGRLIPASWILSRQRGIAPVAVKYPCATMPSSPVRWKVKISCV
jgi:hypothetical protein